MKTFVIDKDHVTYHKALDVLYVTYNDGCLDYCERVEDISPGISVMFNGTKLAGLEILDFSKNFGSLPITLSINSRNPFTVKIPSYE